jgi:hypothetical protein
VCPGCGRPYEAVRFDPPEPRVVVAELAGVGPAETAPCTRHARNVAVAACGRCGQFMCALCRIDADGKPYCPPCFERLSGEGALASAPTRARNHAGLATLCLLMGFFLMGIFITVPAAALGLYFCARGLREKARRGESEGVAGLYVRILLCLVMMAGGVLYPIALFGGLQ